MSTGLIIFSRLDSRRLPGKALMPIADRPLLGHVIDRARRVNNVAEMVVATSTRVVDDPIVDFAKAEGVAVFRGALDDVAGRALACCERFGFARFARVCGDRPFFDPDLVSKLAAIHESEELDLATTMVPRTFPPGLTAEVIGTDALRRALAATDDPQDREHVTSYFYRNPQHFRIHNTAAPEGVDFEGVRLVVDDDEDLERARWIVSRVTGPAAHAPMEVVVQLAKEWAASRMDYRHENCGDGQTVPGNEGPGTGEYH